MIKPPTWGCLWCKKKLRRRALLEHVRKVHKPRPEAWIAIQVLIPEDADFLEHHEGDEKGR